MKRIQLKCVDLKIAAMLFETKGGFIILFSWDSREITFEISLLFLMIYGTFIYHKLKTVNVTRITLIRSCLQGHIVL